MAGGPINKTAVQGRSRSVRERGLVWDVLVLSACRGGEIVRGEKEHSTLHPSPSELSWEDSNAESHGAPSSSGSSLKVDGGDPDELKSQCCWGDGV